jgi:hypothetical protein
VLVQLWDLSKVIAALPKERIAAGQLAHLYGTPKALPGARRRRKLVLRPSYVDFQIAASQTLSTALTLE